MAEHSVEIHDCIGTAKIFNIFYGQVYDSANDMTVWVNFIFFNLYRGLLSSSIR